MGMVPLFNNNFKKLPKENWEIAMTDITHFTVLNVFQYYILLNCFLFVSFFLLTLTFIDYF